MSELLADTRLLLALRAHLAWNTLVSRPLYQRAGMVCFTLGAGAIAAAAAAAFGLGAGALLVRYPEPSLEGLFPGLILTTATLLLLVTAAGIAFGSLFLASDLELLMSAPVDRRAVFIARLLDGIGWQYAIVGAGALPALAAYGVTLHYGAGYFVLAVVAVLGTPLLPAGLGALLVMLVARYAPARRVREALGLAAALAGVSCTIVGQTARVWWRGLIATGADAAGTLALLEQATALPVPSFVAGRALVAAGTGDVWAALGGLAGFTALTFGLFAGCVVAAERLYATGWVRMQGAGDARRGRARAERETRRRGLLGRAPAVLAIALKDWRVIPRDLRNFAQLLTPILLLPVLYLNLIVPRSGRRFDPLRAADRIAGDLDVTGIALAAGVVLAGTLICSRFALTSISREGPAWWLLKVAPVSPIEVLAGKLLVVLIPYIVVTTPLLTAAGIWNQLSPGGLLYGWLGVQTLGAGTLSIYVGLGVPWARLDWDDPRQMASGWAALLSFVIVAIYWIMAGALLCLPAAATAWWPALLPAAWVLGAGGALGITLAMAVLTLRLAARRLIRVGEP